jgi:hypothetical protein
MNVHSALRRAAAMDGQQLRFRLAQTLRRHAGRLRVGIARPTWDRNHIVDVLAPGSAPRVEHVLEAARRGDHIEAHRELATHLQTRMSRWPLKAAERERHVDRIRNRFADAKTTVAKTAEAIRDGRHHLLGYRDVRVGNPPAWHRDEVHHRQAPMEFWADVRYLDPAHGDHKVIWETNRHQYFLSLGAAWWLTRDRGYRDTFVQHLEDWLARNPPLVGINWASALELAFRAMSWTWAAEFFAAGSEQDTTPWLVDLLVALDRQLTHVEHNLSRYFSPNTHLTGEALALYAVSIAFPELRRSPRRVETGRAVLLHEAEAQVRADGGHAELSAHYHRYSTDFYLLALMVARAANDPAADAFERAAHRQAAYLRTIADDDGRLPLLGDDDGGWLFKFSDSSPFDAATTLSVAAALLSDPSLAVKPTTDEVFWVLGEEPEVPDVGSRAVEWPSHVLDSSGYFVSRSPGGGHLIFDGGPHGFLNGGHAHSDALSVVISAAGMPLFVDPGTATYTMDRAVRDRFRSTRMHNTVIVDGRDPAVPDGPFHWRTRQDARFLVARPGRTIDFAVGALAGSAGRRHMRAVLTLHGTGWLIVDRVTSDGACEAEAWWHLYPAWRGTPSDGTVWLDGPGRTRLGLATSVPDVLVTRDPDLAACAPVYGQIEVGTAIRIRAGRRGPFSIGTFVPSAPIAIERLRIREVAARMRATDWTPIGFEIESGDTDMRVELAFPLNAEAQPSTDWPQPCIETRRVPEAKETVVCAE